VNGYDESRKRRRPLFDDIIEGGFIDSGAAWCLIDEFRSECEGNEEAMRRFDFAAEAFIDAWQAAREADVYKRGRTVITIEQDGEWVYDCSVNSPRLAEDVRSICQRHFGRVEAG
jgi:hypothetical protein